MEGIEKVFNSYNKKEKEYLVFKMEMNAFFGTPSPQNAKEFKEWCDKEIKELKKRGKNNANYYNDLQN